MLNKNVRAVIVGAAITSSAFMMSSKAYAAEVKGKVVNVSTNLRIRSSASLSGKIVGHLKANDVVNIDGQSGNWYHISYKNIKGYVSADYIEKISSNDDNSDKQPSDTVAGKTGQVVNVSSYLRLRKGPSTTSAVIGELKDGQEFKIEGESGDWYKVNVKGKIGYLHKDYVKVIKNSSSNGSGNTNEPQKPVTPEKPVEPQKPVTPEKPVEPQKPVAPEKPVEPQKPVAPEKPSEPQKPGETEVRMGITHNVSTSLRIRQKASVSSLVVGYIYPSQSIKILGESGDWYHVDVNGKIGYSSKQYIKIVSAGNSSGQAPSKPSKPSIDNENQDTYNKVLEIMKKQIGSPYVYGGAGEILTKELIDSLKVKYPSYAEGGKYDNALKEVGKGYRAFDCSGLMYWSFNQVGIKLDRSTYGQINNGVEVSLDELKPGDLLFYKSLGHVGMYIGNGQWIESPNHNGCVRIINVPWNSIGRARRVIGK